MDEVKQQDGAREQHKRAKGPTAHDDPIARHLGRKHRAEDNDLNGVVLSNDYKNERGDSLPRFGDGEGKH